MVEHTFDNDDSRSVPSNTRLLAKWLWILFWLNFPVVAFQLVSALTSPPMSVAGQVAARLVSLFCCWVLLQMKRAEKQYKIAAICGFCANAFFLSSELLTYLTQGWNVAFLVVGALFSVATSYCEYCAHSRAIGAIDEKLGNAWTTLRKWYLGALCIAMVGICFARSSFLLGTVIVLAAMLVLLVTTAIILVTLYRSARLCRTVSATAQ